MLHAGHHDVAGKADLRSDLFDGLDGGHGKKIAFVRER
jgi:hypothetical protein